MSAAGSSNDELKPDGGGDDIFAAEYVLGALSDDDRRLAALRIEAEQPFARLVDRWQADFSPLGADYAEAEVPETVKAAIDRRLFPDGAQPDPAEASRPQGSIAFWRALAIAALLVLAYIAAPSLTTSKEELPPVRLAASLTGADSGVRYLAVFDERTEDIGLARLSGEPGEEREFELWVVREEQAPVSLGVIRPGEEDARMPINEAQRLRIVPGAILSISDEPVGGSASGQPTGKIVARGTLSAI